MINIRLAIACAVLGIALIVSALANWQQLKVRVELQAQHKSDLAAEKSNGERDLKICGATNTNVVATVKALGEELHACRGEEQRTNDALALANRQRDRARAAADGELRMRQAAIEAIGKNHANDCDRPICRALSDELLRNSAAVGAADQ